MNAPTCPPAPPSPRPRRQPPTAEPRPGPGRGPRGERGSTSSLELMALTPMLALGVLLIAWAANSARAELATSLAAQEAAVAAAVCCNTASPGEPGDGNSPGDAINAQARREHTAAAVLAARPGLDYLCQHGPQPPPGRTGFVAHAQADLTDDPDGIDLVRSVLVVTTHVTCEADGAIAPVRGLFSTRTVHGHGAHVTVIADTPQTLTSTPGDGNNEGRQS